MRKRRVRRGTVEVILFVLNKCDKDTKDLHLFLCR